MISEPLSQNCRICGEPHRGTDTICSLCEGAFESVRPDERFEKEAPLDFAKYTSPSFPWEPLRYQPTLMSSHRGWIVLALILVILVLLLALLRAPLPSCWEISS
jgi:hypothetical protein